MEPTNPATEAQAGLLHARVRGHLADSGIRFTRGRRLVVEALEQAPGPRSAAELHDRLGGAVPLSSLYRSLGVLEDAGVLERIHDPNGLARYELAEWLSGHHHHLVCVECGTARDIELGEGLERSVARLARTLAGELDFRVSGHRLELEGMCETCLG